MTAYQPSSGSLARSLSSYHQTQVTTADKREIVLYLYDGAIRFLNQALEAVERGDVPAKCQQLSRAMDIVMELTCMLDFEQGGEIAVRLSSLYTFALQSLLQANLEKDLALARKPIRHSITILSIIRDGWKQIIKYTNASSAPQDGGDLPSLGRSFIG